MSQLNSSATPTLIAKDGTRILDGWALLNDEDVVGADGPYVLGFERALTELPGLNGRYGVRVNPGDDIRLLTPYMEKIALVEVNFPGYRDGRGYSTARILRSDLNYQGEIRAVGDVLRDQLFLMLRCGFNEFVLKDADPEGAIKAATDRFENAYQTAADARQPIWALRQKLTEA
ncbi:DUF934 domain-containing protein [Asticcacaulis sp. ZE23SCel15]|uniref:DUF934 domain-containing protein n=1 Tax=Asticcacaulis sp. ZE23SCel15 TaxID=3059027 RepID=UPI00265FFA5A|nr:DUF934 domain-containing protein [Asticcacaulis sp. ZE23SCel15]WKL58113.1 DUF934 domain-containing protein [Asticcacaulis sp. ZE23SCel15]